MLNTSFYHPIREKCGQIAAELVITDSKEALSHIFNLMEARQQSLMRYLEALAEKSSTGHDCRFCTGGCDMAHAEHLMVIKESHSAISSHIVSIDMNELPDDLQQLANLIMELMRVEEEVLVPKIWSAQKQINVVS
jgi:hypothetical protein